MSNPATEQTDQAMDNIIRITECLEQAAKVSANLHGAVRDLQEIVKMQQRRIERLEDKLNEPSRSFGA